MATNVKFSTGLEEDLLKLNSDKTYVNKIENGHIYFTTRTNDEGEVIGSIFYDVDGKRVSMGGGIAEQAKADDMKQNIADTYVSRISSEGVKYADTDGVTITTYNGRNVALDTIMLPVASASRAGTVITGAQTFAGNKTFNNNILFPNVSTGVSSGIRWTVGDNDGARIVTGATAANAGYLEIAVKDDGNEPIYVRQYSGDFATLVRTLTLLDASGNTIIPGSLLPTAKDTKDLGSETYRWNNAYIKNVQADTLSGHLTGSLTGNVTGNVTGHASLDLPLAGGTMTGDITFAAIASWPTASGETYPIKSKGLKWSGSSDTAAIYYQVDGSDSGHLYISMGDDDAASVKFAKSGTAHTIFDAAGKLYPVTNDTGYIGTSSNKFKAIYATNFYGIIEKAYQDESGNNIKATYASTLKNHAHDGSGWSFRLLNKNGAALSDALTIPGATDKLAGLITTGEQTFAGKKTFNGQVVIANTTDAAKATANSGALIVGDPTGEHLAIDGNEIMAKASGTTTRALLFQLDGGETKFGGNVLPYATDTHSLGTEALAWKEAHIGEIYGHLNGSLTGPVSGNASTASKWLTARKITMTGDVTGNFTIDGSKDVSFASSIANYSIKPVKLAIQDYANYAQLNRHTAASWGFSVDTSSSDQGAIYTMTTLSRDKFISEEFPCKGGEKLIISYEISTSVKGNSTSGGTDSTYRGTAIGIYGYKYANKNTSAGISYSTRVTGTADAPWTKVESIVTVPATARYFFVFVQTESWGNFSGSLKIRNLEVRSAGGVTDAKGDEILPKYITKIDFAQANVSSTDTTKKLNIRLYDGNNAIKSTIQVPNAAADAAGVVNTGTQTFAGNKTFTGRIHLSNTTDAALGSDSGVLTIGNKSGEHMILDGNEIMVKASATTSAILHIQAEGGQTEIGGAFIPKGDKAHDLGASSHYWKNAYISNLVADTLSGHLTGSMTGNVTGNASSATKLLTARNIILGNDLQGSVSFDGTKDVTISAASYSASIGGGNTANYPWHRIATTGANAVTSNYNDKDVIIAIRHSYHDGGWGIAKVSMRTNNASGGATASCSIKWMVRFNIAEDALQAGFRNTAADSYADLYYKCGTYPRATVYQLQGNRTWTLISSTEANDTTTSDAKTSKEAYATIAAGGTALGRTYTHTIVAEDASFVAKAYMDESGNNIKTSYLASIQQVTSDKDTFTFRGYNKNNAAMNNLITIPAATASDASSANWKAGLVTSLAQTWAGEKTFRDGIRFINATTGLTPGINWTMGDNDYARIRAGATASNGGYLEIATADDANEPIYVRQYSGVFATLKRTLTLLDASGNTILPGSLTLTGNIMPSADNTYVIGDLSNKWKDVYSQDMHVYQTIYVNTSTSGSVGGIGLHGTQTPTTYGIAMRSGLNTHGYVTDTWATHFSMVGSNKRGWIFRHENAPVASINGEGYAQFNKISLNRAGNAAFGRISWWNTGYHTWYDYMADGTVASSAPTGGQPSVLGTVTTWALRSLIQNSATYGWVWEATTEAAASATSTRPTALMALASDTGKLYLKNDINIITGDNDRFIHFLYNTKNSDGFTVDSTVNTVGASWRAGVKQSTSDNEFAIESGSASPTATAWLNGLKITQATLNATFGTTTLGGLGIANTSASTGHGISLYNGGMSGKPTYGLMFAGTATFKTHGYVTGDWATYFTMNDTANRGWIFLKGANPVASISNDGKANFGETYIRGPLKIGDNANGDTNYIAFYGTTGDNPGSFNHAYIGENLWGTSERSELLIFKGNDIGATATASGSGPDRIRHVAAAHLFQIYTSALSGTWTTICDSTVPVSVFEINQSGIVVTGAAAISGNTTVGGTLGVTGNTTLGGELSVTSYAKFKQGSAATGLNTGAVQIAGGLSASAASYIGGALTVNSTISATGNVTAPRFIGLADRATYIDSIYFGTTTSYLTTTPGAAGRMAFYYNVNPCTGLFPATNNANFMITLNKHSGSYDSQLGFSSDGNIYYRSFNGSALNTTSGWQMLLTTSNAFGELDGRYVNVTGDTMTGALNLANGTWNKAGDDAYFGDNNTAGSFAIQGINGSTNLKMVTYGGTSYGTITWNGSQFVFSNQIVGNLSGSITGSAESLSGKFYANRMVNPNNSGVRVGAPPLTVLGLMNSGYAIYNDAEFASGTNSVSVYNNSGNGTVVHTRMQDSSAANTSGYVLRIQHTGTAQPGWGGFYQNISSRANAIFAQIFRAKIPVGYNVNVASNSMGTSYSDYWVTDTAGTGKWEWYCRIVLCGETGSFSSGGHVYLTGGSTPSSSAPITWYLAYCNCFDLTKGAYLNATKVYGAVWNDYAEYRRSDSKIAPGRVVIETGYGDLILASERLQAGANIVSDTFGFAIGQTDKTQTPIAVSGRVLAYPYEDRNSYKAGDPVCTGPDGTISKMSREEVQKYPDRIVGTVSEIPQYEEWGTGNVKINGRIWIKVK